jgi:hypothetical protein
MSHTVPGNDTDEAGHAVLRRRIQRFVGVEMASGFDTVPPRPELVHSAPDDIRLASRLLRFVHRGTSRP